MRRFLIALFLAVSLAPVQDARAIEDHPLRLLVNAEPVTGTTLARADVEARPVVVTFFASWCPPCTDEFKALNAVRESYGEDKLTIVAVNIFEKWGGKENPVRMARFLKRTKPQFFVVKGSEAMAKGFGNITRIPSLIVYDPKGEEVWRFVHLKGAKKMSATTEEIVKAVRGALDGDT